MSGDRSRGDRRRPATDRPAADRRPPGGSARNTRAVAAQVLARIDHDEAYANLALSAVLERSGLDQRDKAFVTDMVYGTTRMRRACHVSVSRFLAHDPPDEALVLLHLGAWQLAYGNVPPHAALSATVDAAAPRFRPLVNAVLRKVAAAPEPAGGWPSDGARLSYPDWLVDRLVADLGPGDALAALEAMNAARSATRRDDGYSQDLASTWVAEAVGAQPDDLVVDLCAAPGGKATALAGAGARVVAADIHPHRAGLVAKNARRLRLRDQVDVLVADGSSAPLRPGCADKVLVDAPCSNLGSLRGKADARWRVDPDAPERLAATQRALVLAGADLVKPGGELTYAVCTLTRAETVGVAGSVMQARPDLVPLVPPGEPWRPWGPGALLLPQTAETDGMAVFRWRVGG